MKRFCDNLTLKFLILPLLLIVATAPKASAQDEPDPVKWTLKIETQDRKHLQNDKFSAVLSAEIEKGWHLYALEKIDGGPFPTRISLTENQPFEIGKITASAPIETDDRVFGVVTKFYENSAKFILPIRVLQNSETDKLQIKVRYQICNDEMCLPPKSVLVETVL